MTIRIAIIGFGKIANDEHWPAIRDNPAFTVAAVAGGRATVPEGIPRFEDHHALIEAVGHQIDAVAICTPPAPRHTIARDCLNASLDVLLEKPPTATLGELDDLVETARKTGQVLYAAWHSQHAPAIRPAAAALRGKQVASLAIAWCEDVRRWHPGQDWVLGPGGFGVLDAGINALSMVSAICPTPMLIDAARLLTPSNRQAPIAAELIFVQPECRARFDWRATHAERRSIIIETEQGSVIDIGDGGMALAIDGIDQRLERRPEYPPIYAHFADLVARRGCDVDAEPLRMVADAFLVGSRETVDPFDWT